MKRWAICYVSSASPAIEETDINEVLSWTQSWNTDHNITGFLLYSEGNFFQVLEGDELKVKDVFQKIEKDRRHRNLFKIFNREIKQDQYDEYSCEFLSKYNESEELNENYYLQYLKNLDHSSQTAVKNILKAFVD
ncbi:BLUF domain-containing protein [Zunongwangia sp. SCSIO 43204]|uniref:Sensors of blue-light using FAD n=1 Tax=Zunongwangia mangrovi TaxID=1334022 RepID=A0A1I1KJ70_9FLAO|nr:MULTISPECIES: BLUF domain-containing protein [Zunongwangia]UAB84239.1 BLUF domain-containing protein [Zunongwangia sp. SCSIO 43204]SFC60312.1 Sensors of blue-light using FAD [Zunongwangia mangrovi]